MEKEIKTAERKCPVCEAESRQMKKGFNRSGTQRYLCGKCGATYTPEPKGNAYDEETRALAIKIYYAGASGRGVGKVFGFSKANVYNWIKKNDDA
jgi:transposase-like protein